METVVRGMTVNDCGEIGVTQPHHIDGLVRAAGITLGGADIAALETLADAAGVNTRGWWEREMAG